MIRPATMTIMRAKIITIMLVKESCSKLLEPRLTVAARMQLTERMQLLPAVR